MAVALGAIQLHLGILRIVIPKQVDHTSQACGQLCRRRQHVYLRDALAKRRPAFDWETEYHIAGTPVDVGGASPTHLVVIELEWRRADPADNTAPLFRHLSAGCLQYD
jgi:hypothetical protein